ncbi:MAG: WG repeat-containing protein, partial [Bacteroidota bacterium]
MKSIYTCAALALCTYSFGQQLFIVNADNKFGVVNENGVEIIAAKYSSIDEFDNIHANWAKVGLDNLYGF